MPRAKRLRKRAQALLLSMQPQKRDSDIFSPTFTSPPPPPPPIVTRLPPLTEFGVPPLSLASNSNRQPFTPPPDPTHPTPASLGDEFAKSLPTTPEATSGNASALSIPIDASKPVLSNQSVEIGHEATMSLKSPKQNFAISEENTHLQVETVETILHEKVESEGERDMLKKRLKDLKKNLESEEGKRLTRSIKEKNSEINALKTKIEVLEEKAREVVSRESVLKKYNHYLESTNELLEGRLKAKDEFNLQYINRTMATERLLEESNFGQDVEELEDQMEKEISEFERYSVALHDDNVSLRNLYKSLKSRAMELIEEQKKMPNISNPALIGETLTSSELYAIPKEPRSSPAFVTVTEECPICLADIFAAPAAVLDPCGHFFHEICITTLNANKTCPTCCVPHSHLNIVD